KELERPAHAALDCRLYQRFLRAEESKDVRLRDSDGSGDRLRRHAVRAVVREADERRLEDRLAAFLGGQAGSCRGAPSRKLALTYNRGQDRADAIDVSLGQPRMEREREGSGEAGVRGRERPLIVIGAKAVERVRADLRLDAIGPQRRERLVAAVELDDIRL